MDIDKIKAQLQKYYNGETSLEDEATLREALKSIDELPDEIKADAELFTMMNALAEDTTDKEFEVEEKSTREVTMPVQRSMDFTWFSRIAAGFTILIIGVLSGWIIGNQNGSSDEVVAMRC